MSRCRLVDRVHASLAPEARALIRDLVLGMSAEMQWGTGTFATQGGVLHDHDQLLRYCRGVLGLPVLFATRLTRLHHTGRADLDAAEQAACMRSGELIQLANVTRDIEKDLARGVAFHPALEPDLGRTVDGDGALAERLRRVREELLLLALSRAESFRGLVAAMDQSRLSLTRASATLMLLFTERYYRGCAVRVGRPAWGRRRSGVGLVAAILPTILSRGWTRRLVDRTVDDLAHAARDDAPATHATSA